MRIPAVCRLGQQPASCAHCTKQRCFSLSYPVWPAQVPQAADEAAQSKPCGSTVRCCQVSVVQSLTLSCRELRKKERLEREMKELKSALEARQADIKAKSAAATQAEEQVQRLEQSLKESQVRLDLTYCQACLSGVSVVQVTNLSSEVSSGQLWGVSESQPEGS